MHTNSFDASEIVASARRQDQAITPRMFEDIAMVVDITLVVMSGILIKYIYISLYLDAEASSSYASCILIVAVSLLAGLRRQNYYEDILKPGVWRGYFSLFLIVAFAFGLSLFVLFAIKVSALFSRGWFASWLIATYAILLVTHVCWRTAYRRLMQNGYLRTAVIVIGSGEALQNTIARLKDEERRGPVSIAGVYTLCSNDRIVSGSKALDLKSQFDCCLQQIVMQCQTGSVSDVIVALPASENDTLRKAVEHLRLLPVNVNIVPDFGELDLSSGTMRRYENFGAIGVQRIPISEWGVFVKKIEDILIATIALFVFAPAMVLIAIAIKLDSPGPVFFRQRRHGFNNKIIHVLKFRSMTVQEDGQRVVQASKSDSRVTRVGRILRRTSLDELPQFLNVLKGDMSVVGPRPHALAHNDYYSRLLANYATRHRVKPGITGWAQINGFRGEVLEPSQMEQRVRLDLEYIDNWAIWLDIKIILMTPIFGFISRKAY
ncbi:undecaprenyl-phosphate glucose phosphotransferase [Rhodomicrobium sp. Az07]|uniref:undecaprenyl-phosphate glucose phosphotransferase n=1 Tax=Rhodomicrobium sp. Az07 TaxID=2839034 RepID=UPI001BECF365|nr:undecaprenyl-phosphate glucose phosphotransferase [Rhodomicrobium sp. Az07]MBT3069828.1 undecaprenyl-phosphate glucose phosphotransferase [Rhodomicrobium sp. Az07]